jgi:transcriptional regulator with XRE-family HTH domain
MTNLAKWLRNGLDQRGLTLARAAVFAGVGQATLSDILNKGHIPKVETLLRLADYFGASREGMLRLAADLVPGAGGQGEALSAGDDDLLISELLEEFRRLPDEWKQEAIAQVAFLNRLAQRPAVRVIGEEAGKDDNPRSDDGIP